MGVLQVNKLLDVLRHPYKEQAGAEQYAPMPPEKIRLGMELLSCSS